jgi:hypothetical protein
MKIQNALCALVFSSTAMAAESLVVPEEFRGVWASSHSACASGGRRSLIIRSTSVDLDGVSGRLNAVTTTGSRAIEVIYEKTGGRSTSRQVRTYTLTADGSKLRETRVGNLVATRVRCDERR